MILPGPLVSARWLRKNFSEVVLADVRWYLDGSSGRAAWEQGHIPGSVWVDLDADLSGPPTEKGGRHPLPSPDHFADVMSASGIGDDSVVVAYDDSGGITAGRLWWMLSVLGRPVAVLDGGLGAWPEPLTQNTEVPRPASFSAAPWPTDRFASTEQVNAARANPALLLLDARNGERFCGVENEIDPRFGHIPGAVSAPCTDNLDESSGLLVGPESSGAYYRSLGATPSSDIIAYCGSGVSACLDLLALEQAGYHNTRLYVGSWSAWGADTSLPMET